MSTAGQSLVQQVKQLLGQLLLDRGFQDDKLGHAINKAAQLARDAGGCLLSRPRRGVEASNLIACEWLEQLGVKAESLPAVKSPEHECLVAVEQWREAEALLLAPHSMGALKQLPELQQLISLTAVQAVTAAGAPGCHAQIVAEAASKLCPASHASSSDVLQCMLKTAQLQKHKTAALGPEAQLFETLSPHMRLCLAADVAAGMLCPEQPPPPDTPEHAAALQVFLAAAVDAAIDECISEVGGLHSGSTPSRLFNTFSGHPQHSSGGTGLGILPSAGDVRSWPLAPLADLQLQVPPQLLLQQVVKLQEQAQHPHAALQHHHRDSLATSSQAVGVLMRSSISRAVHEPALAGHAQQANSMGHSAAAAAGAVSDNQVAAAVMAVLQPDGHAGFSEQSVNGIASLAYCLVLQFLQGQLQCAGGANSAQWQQAVPLQALQLLAAVRDLEAAGHAAVAAAAAAAAAAASHAADASAAHAADADAERLASTAAQQRIVHMLLSLVRQVRHYQECNTAAAVQGSSSGMPQQIPQEFIDLPPHKAFAAGSQQGLEQGSTGLGLWWQPPELQTGVAAGAEGGVSISRGSSNSSSKLRLGEARGQQGSSHSTYDIAAMNDVLKVTAKLATHLQNIDNVLLVMLCSEETYDTLQEPQHSFAELAASQAGPYLESRPDLKQQAQQVLSFLHSRGFGLEVDQLSGIASCMLQPGALAASLHCFRQHKLCDVGAGAAADAWEDCIAAAGTLHGLRQHSTASQHSMLGGGGEWHDWGETQGHSVSLSGVNLRSREAIAAWVLDSEMRLGRSYLRVLVDRTCNSLMPMVTWHQGHWVDTLLQHRTADSWCKIKLLAGLAAGCTDKASGGTAGSAAGGKQRIKSQGLGKPSTCSGSDGGSRSGGSGSSTGSTDGSNGSSNERWVSGACDWHFECNLCNQEQSSSSKGKPGSSNGSGNADSSSKSHTSSSGGDGGSPFLSFPVPYDDPFLYRRLLWRLLGKLSPEAQALLAKHAHICPHHTDMGAWLLACDVLRGCLWTPPTQDLLDLALSTHRAHISTERAAHVKQYSRALNQAFVRSYHPSTVLVSRQVLLALSPLHHQVLPPPEVAHLLPSSFAPAVGKALMQQLFEVPVLDGFEHQHCRLQLWHVWWHVGLRLYAAQQQQAAFVTSLPQQQSAADKSAQKQSKSKGRSSSSSSSSSSSKPNSSGAQRGPASKQTSNSAPLDAQQRGFGWKGLSGADLEALYMDPQARLFAVGYATRQMSGLLQQPPAHAQRLQRLQQEAIDYAQRFQLDCLRSAFPSIETTLQAAQQADAETAGHFDSDTPHEDAVWGDLSAALSMTDVLAVGQPELLAAVSGPRDLLIPPAQQKLQPTAATNVAEFQAVCHYLGHCPPRNGAELYLDNVCMEQSQQQRKQLGLFSQRQGLGKQQQLSEQALWQKQQQRRRQQIETCDHSVRGPALLPLAQQSDVSQLMLQSPCPAEALGDPLVWWRWQQTLLGLDTCDTCGSAKPALICGDCEAASYCSTTCQENDVGHRRICQKLQEARQRYRASDASLPPERSSFPVLAQLMHPDNVEPGRLQQLGCCGGSLSGLDGPTFPHGSSLVAPEDLIRAQMGILKEGAGRTRSGSNSTSAGGAGSRSSVKSSQREAGRPSAQPLSSGTQLAA